MKKLSKSLLILVCCCLSISQTIAFCGFYVSQADADLFNESSQVIIVKDGKRTVITMSNDFKGTVSDFAMIVPVPTVLAEKDIRIADQKIFEKLDAYSGPRLVEYHDNNPCTPPHADMTLESVEITSTKNVRANKEVTDKDYGVTIEATYTVGEYDILILSAKVSDGLEQWLLKNGYTIPDQAQEVLQPYIKSQMKFFVVKVNLKKQKSSNYRTLRPLQISFDSDKFMLPIRLGMANATNHQDLIIYALTKTGRVETTNYRTVNIPTDKNIPQFLKTKDLFGNFYVDLFNKEWERQNQNAVFLEYAWDLSPRNYVKCDPCVGTPPQVIDLQEAGVFWLNNPQTLYQESVYFTRLHVRYNRVNFPQDLQFQSTPNRKNFQGRYIISNPAQGQLDCTAGQDYIEDLIKRRKNELAELAVLTDWQPKNYQFYIDDYEHQLKKHPQKNNLFKKGDKNNFPIIGMIPTANQLLPILLLLVLLGSLLGFISTIVIRIMYRRRKETIV